MAGDEEQSRLRLEIETFENVIQQLKAESMAKDESIVKLERKFLMKITFDINLVDS